MLVHYIVVVKSDLLYCYHCNNYYNIEYITRFTYTKNILFNYYSILLRHHNYTILNTPKCVCGYCQWQNLPYRVPKLNKKCQNTHGHMAVYHNPTHTMWYLVILIRLSFEAPVKTPILLSIITIFDELSSNVVFSIWNACTSGFKKTTPTCYMR